MAQLLDNIAEYLETEGFGTRGEDIFIGFLPDDEDEFADNVVFIDQTGGIAPDKDIPVAKPTVQIVVRSAEYDNGFEKLQQIFDRFHGVHDDFALTVGGVDIMRAYAINEPQHLERDGKERDLFTCTFVFQFRK